jgi:hypothetical protein
MTKLIKFSIVSLIFGISSVYASSEQTHTKGHSEHNASHKHINHVRLKNEVDKKTIEKMAIQELQRLILAKKISPSWEGLPISKIGKTHYGDTNDWVVGFDNLRIKNIKRQTLYIFVSVTGEIRGVNYTGN